jgi:hypothetical protein
MSRSRLPLSPDDARQVLWARCLEEADATGAVVPAEARASASRAAKDAEDAAFLVRRSALVREIPGVPEAPQVQAGGWLAKLPPWTPLAVLAAALVIGWTTNELGTAGTLNLLAFPLLGLILWNLSVCVLSLWFDWKSRRKPGTVPAVPRRAPGMDALSAARLDFSARVQAWEKPRAEAKTKFMLHAAAIALALGIVAGMYGRGLTKEYKATWESTFLDRPAVRNLTVAVLGPASLLTGIAVPDPGDPDHKQPAAPWIHLWAASALIFIGIPRLILMNMARLHAAKSEPDYRGEFSDYLQVCRSLASGGSQKADVLPVHYQPESRTRDALRLALQHHWGAHVGADFLKPLAYGSEDNAVPPPAPERLAIIIPLAVTPEAEIHGALLHEAAAAIPDRTRRLLVLDAESFESRFRALPEYPQRLASRRAAWQKAAAGTFPVLLLDEAARRDPAAAIRTITS